MILERCERQVEAIRCPMPLRQIQVRAESSSAPPRGSAAQEEFCGYEVGETITDHDVALSYVMMNYPAVLGRGGSLRLVGTILLVRRGGSAPAGRGAGRRLAVAGGSDVL